MPDEKRAFVRIHAKVIANCAKSENDTMGRQYFLSVTKDLSLHGAGLVLPEEIKTGENIALALELPIYFMPILIYCEVVWVKKAQGIRDKIQDVTEAGIKFLKIGPRDMEKLNDYLRFKENELKEEMLLVHK